MPLRRSCSILAIALAAAVFPAEAQEQAAETGDVHVVRPGDTLWDLAGRYLRNPFRWPEIHALNRDRVRDPHWIYPQDRLLLPGSRGEVAVRGAPIGLDPTDSRQVQRGAEGRTVFFVESRVDAVPISGLLDARVVEAPAVPIGAYLGAGMLLPEAELVAVGTLAEIVSPTVIARRAAPQIQPYDRVYVQLSGSVAPGDRLHLLRRGRRIDPYGTAYLPTGEGVVLAVQGTTATIEVDRFYDRVEVGDIAVPLPSFAPRVGVAAQPASGLDGTLLALGNPQPVVGTEDLGFVDLGTASGVVEGDEFEIYMPAVAAGWGVRPEIVIGRLQVVRAGRLTSAVRVLSLEHPALEAGLPVRLVARMP